jgi:hypothetical protein
MPSRDVAFCSRLQDCISASLNLVDFPCQHTDGYNKPEIELQDNHELLLDPQDIRSAQGRVLIERSINSARLSIQVCMTCGCACLHPTLRAFALQVNVCCPSQLGKADCLELWLRRKRINSLQRTKKITIIRRAPVHGFDLSLLVTVRHLQTFKKEMLASFIVHLINDGICPANVFKRSLAARCQRFSLTIGSVFGLG